MEGWDCRKVGSKLGANNFVKHVIYECDIIENLFKFNDIP